MVKNLKKENVLEKISFKVIGWIGTPKSLVVHSLFFVAIPALSLFGLDLRINLLILTTWLSIEAIYLAILIQMTINHTTTKLEGVEEDIEDIQEDVQGLEGNVEEISEDIDKIQVEDQNEEENTEETLDNIEDQMKKIIESLESLKRHVHSGAKHP